MANQAKKRKDDQPKELAEARRVPDVIEERKDWIIDKWLERVKLTEELKAVNLSEAERKDHLPDLLDEAIARACGHRVKLEERQKAAERHGTLRYHQGYSIPMLILETYLLQDVISECIRNNFPIKLNSLVSDMAKICTTLAAELEESARAYMNNMNGTNVLARKSEVKFKRSSFRRNVHLTFKRDATSGRQAPFHEVRFEWPVPDKLITPAVRSLRK